jgi:hypothetical protein
MANSTGKFNPPNVFSDMAWNAVWNHVTKQKTTNIIGIYNCKIFYSTYISLISSYSNLSNTDNIEIYLTNGLETFFQWARINKNRFESDSEHFVSYYSNELIDPYINHFSLLFYNEIKKMKPRYSYNHNTPYFMLLFEIDSPKDDKEIYDEEYFFDNDIEISRIEDFYEIIYSNFETINNQFDLLLHEKDKLKLASWPTGKVTNIISDQDFFESLVIKPFNEARCFICGNFTSREELSLNVEANEGWILPMCPRCKQNNF